MQKDIKESYKKLEEIKTAPSFNLNQYNRNQGYAHQRPSSQLSLPSKSKAGSNVSRKSDLTSNHYQTLDSYPRTNPQKLLKNAEQMLNELKSDSKFEKIAKTHMKYTNNFLNDIMSENYKKPLDICIKIIRSLIENEKNEKESCS